MVQNLKNVLFIARIRADLRFGPSKTKKKIVVGPTNLNLKK